MIHTSFDGSLEELFSIFEDYVSLNFPNRCDSYYDTNLEGISITSDIEEGAHNMNRSVFVHHYMGGFHLTGNNHLFGFYFDEFLSSQERWNLTVKTEYAEMLGLLDELKASLEAASSRDEYETFEDYVLEMEYEVAKFEESYWGALGIEAPEYNSHLLFPEEMAVYSSDNLPF